MQQLERKNNDQPDAITVNGGGARKRIMADGVGAKLSSTVSKANNTGQKDVLGRRAVWMNSGR